MSSFVYSLIHEMTMREKAYFKRYSQMYNGKRDKNYIQLYNELEKMEDYDIDVLKSRFAGQTIEKYLNSELNYLLGQLLKCLVNFYLDSSIEKKIQKSVLYVDILIDKGYQKQALKILIRVEKTAKKHEDFTTILKIIQLKEEILFNEGIIDFTKQLKTLDSERQKIFGQIKNLNILRLRREQMRDLQMSNEFHKRNDNYPSFFYDSILESKEEVLSARGLEHWFYILAVRHYLLSNYEEAKLYFSKAIDHVQEYYFLFKKSKILPLLSNYLFMSARLKDKVSFFNKLPVLEALESESTLDQDYIQFIKLNRLFELYYQVRDYQASIKLEEEVLEFMQSKKCTIEPINRNYLYMCIVRSCIITNRYDSAMNWLNEWSQFGVSEYFLVNHKLFSLIIHYEFGLTDLIQSEIDTTYKMLKRHEKNNEKTKAFFHFFKMILRSPKKKKELLQNLRMKLISLDEQSKRKNYFIYFDFMIWVEQKISNSSTSV